MHGLSTINKINEEARRKAAENARQPLLPFVPTDCLAWGRRSVVDEFPRFNDFHIPAGYRPCTVDDLVQAGVVDSGMSLGTFGLRSQPYGRHEEILAWKVAERFVPVLHGEIALSDLPELSKKLFELLEDKDFHFGVGIITHSGSFFTIVLFVSEEKRFRRPAAKNRPVAAV